MFKIEKQSANRLDIELRGTINIETMRTGLDALIKQSKDVESGQMLYTIRDFSMPTIGAIGIEMSRLPALFSLLGKYDKCAVLSDSSWLRNAATAKGALIPGLDIMSFELDEREAAEAWLSDLSA